METYKRTDKKSYNILKEVPLRIRRNYARVILSFAKPKQSILDAGFGSGSILIPLAQENRLAEIVGIDYSKPLFNSVSREIKNKAKIFLEDILKFSGEYDIVHFKAILHCFHNPKRALDKLASLTKQQGLIITAHENSQIEDRIEQIFANGIADEELELLLEYYFALRTNLGKPFIWRKYPAGNSKNAVAYLCKNNKFKLIKKIQGKSLSWNRKFKLSDLFYSIRNRTYKVFDEGLTKRENDFILEKMTKFSRAHKIDLSKERFVPANFEIYVLKKN